MDLTHRFLVAPRTVRMCRASVAACAALLVAVPAEAHGEATGAQEFLQHNLVTLGFLAVIVVAAAALSWVNRPSRSAGSPSVPTAADSAEHPAD